MADAAQCARAIVNNVERVIIGKRQQIVLAVVSWLCRGHVLLEDVPGVAKTILARALAASLGCRFKRIQCTPDLLPTDVTGTSVFNVKTHEFEFRPGPIFAHVVLVDEINRATPRTQSALLEAMAEGSVTIDGRTHELERPFLIIATQNPVEHEGTFPLPEAQLDRFFMRFSLGYPSKAEEVEMLSRLQHRHPIEQLQPVVSLQELLQAQEAVTHVQVHPKVQGYIVDLVHATREHEDVALGGSPRASLALFRAAQAVALVRGRQYVVPDDVQRIATAVLNHRMLLKPESRLRGVQPTQVVDEVLRTVPVPTVALSPRGT